MTRDSYGTKQYIAVEGLDKALTLAKAIMQAHDCQVLIQEDDCGVYIVSWANRYRDNTGEEFVWMNEPMLDDYDEYLAAKEAAQEAE